MTKMIDLRAIPDKPGCYLFKDSEGKIIYVGKAKDLRKRVSSYFQKKDLDPKTELLVGHIDSADFIVTDSEVEALILENNLIKKNRPKYNIDLRDSKRYAYVVLTEEEFPRLLLARRRDGKGKFFGPFVSAEERDYVLSVLIKAFRLRTCKRLPKKACLRQHIGLCSAPCVGAIDKGGYAGFVSAVESVLGGKTSKLAKRLEAEMRKASERREFERAQELKKQIEAIKYLGERQKMERGKEFDEDVLNYEVKNGKVYLMLFNVARGILENKQDFEFDYVPEFLEEFIVQYYSENKIPKEIILPCGLNPAMAGFFKEKRGNNVIVTIPERGEKKQLLDLVAKNIEITFFGGEKKLEDLREKLNLDKLPTVIECFDVSHLSGTSNVASMVQFRDGRADKSNYRRFKIKGFSGADDFRSIGEVVRRRYSRLLAEKTGMPDLILIDGGKGQLNAAVAEVEKLELKIPAISIAKEFEEIYALGNQQPIRLSERSDALKLLQEIRDEAHRFAISYNRLLRKKKLRE